MQHGRLSLVLDPEICRALRGKRILANRKIAMEMEMEEEMVIYIYWLHYVLLVPSKPIETMRGSPLKRCE